ncbi:DUF3592 domain-containing protein [Dyella marensis]|uniref:DUF3592 domain-containing protein n=1 Tax=Dyella marensis TaxID=500610 RepID=UPI003C2BF0AA
MGYRLQIGWLWMPACLVLSACSSQVASWKRLEEKSEKTTGVVVNVDCSDHGKIFYRFSVNGRQFTNSSYGYSERPCHSIKSGDPIAIYYDPSVPGTNTPMTPSAAVCFYEARAMTPFLVAGFLVLVGAVQLIRKGNPFKQPVSPGGES